MKDSPVKYEPALLVAFMSVVILPPNPSLELESRVSAAVTPVLAEISTPLLPELLFSWMLPDVPNDVVLLALSALLSMREVLASLKVLLVSAMFPPLVFTSPFKVILLVIEDKLK